MTFVLSAIAACTPVGLHAAATCAALRAGVASLKELATYSVDGELFDREPMVGGRVPTEWLRGGPVENQWPGHERFGVRPPPPRDQHVRPGIERILELVAIAAEEVRASAGLDTMRADHYGVYLGLNEADPPDPVVEHLSRALGIAPSRCHTESSGRASVLGLLHRAVSDLQARRIEGALVGGVDSLIRTPMAQRYDRQRRLRSRTAPEGLLPGEAAGFVYLESLEHAEQRQRTIYAQLAAVSTGVEPHAAGPPPAHPEPETEPRRDDEDERPENRAFGKGLSDALRSVANATALDHMPLVVCDLNGEHPRAIEWVLACTRVLGRLHGDLDVWHPAEGIGDVGAAAGAVDLVWAAMALHLGYATRRRVLVWGASEGPLRAAVILDRHG